MTALQRTRERHSCLHSDALNPTPLGVFVMYKTHPALKLAFLLAACLLVQGCVGFVVVRPKAETFKSPGVWDKAAINSVGSPVRGTNSPTTAWLQDHWGKPASVRPVSTGTQGEFWTYKFGRAWYGVAPCLVVPVPLVLPLGREKVVFLVQGDRGVSADVVTTGFSGAMASMVGPDGSPVAFAGW